MKKKRRGRPPVEDPRDMTRSIRVTAGESDLIDAAAGSTGQGPTVWMREIVLRAAKRAAKGG